MAVSNATIEEICRFCRNWFDRARSYGTVTIENGAVSGDYGLLTGQYFRLVGSVFNDGVHKHPASGLTDETFEGAVWAMAVPPSIVALAGEIEDWQTKNSAVLASPFVSESKADYSYSKGQSASGNGGAWSWRDQFAAKLAPWRKI